MSNLRALARHTVLNFLGTFSRPQKGVHILNGHRLCPGTADEQAKDYFFHQLNQLSRYVHFIHIQEAISLIISHKTVKKPLVAFTFDDGFMECHSMIAPVLENFGVNAAFFINPNFVEGNDNYILNFTNNIVLSPGKSPMRWSQIKELHAKGHVIGAHTLDHKMLIDSNLLEMEKQIGLCKTVIERQLSAPCEYFAFPYGRLEHANKMSIDIACKHYKYVFSQSDYKHYFSFDGRVINRRHFEPFWPVKHVFYFLSCNKK